MGRRGVWVCGPRVVMRWGVCDVHFRHRAPSFGAAGVTDVPVGLNMPPFAAVGCDVRVVLAVLHASASGTGHVCGAAC